MAYWNEQTLTPGQLFPPGTTLELYGGVTPDAGSPRPLGDLLGTEVVDVDGEVTFAGLQEGSLYVAGAELDGTWHFIAFATPSRDLDKIEMDGLIEENIGIREELAGTVNRIFNVKDPRFGAVGNGVADDTTPIEKARNAANAAGGGVVYFPPGIYIYSREIAPASHVHWRGAGPNASIIKCKTGGPAYFIKGNAEKGGFTLTNPCLNTSFKDLGFDMNGQDSEFGGVLQFNVGLDGCWVTGCRFFDSNAPAFLKNVGVGDGVKTVFEYTFSTEGELNRKVLSKSISVTDGAGQTFVDDGMGNWVTANSPLQPQPTAVGSISYGGHAVQGKMKITFPVAPPNGAQVKVAYQAVRQRQHIVFLGCANVFIENNVLSHGGRIKCGRPGNRVVIRGNTLRDVNDNAITVVCIGGNEEFAITTDLIITDNIIRNPVLKGVYIGADGETETSPVLTMERVVVEGNIVTGDFESAVFAQLPRVTKEVRVDNNIGKQTHPFLGEEGYGVFDIRFVNEAAVPGVIASFRGNIATSAGAATGMWIRNIEGFVCADNVIYNCLTARGLRIDGCTKGTIHDNTIFASRCISSESGEASFLDFHDNVLVSLVAGKPCFGITCQKALHVKVHDQLMSGLGFGFELKPGEEALVHLHDNDTSGLAEQKFTQEKLAVGSIVRANPGMNPFGAKTTAVPATTEQVAADVYDRDFYITANAASSTEVQVEGGPKITVPKGQLATVRVPAGKPMTPTYANAPTWVVNRL